MNVTSGFLVRSDKALSTATMALRFAVMQDLMADRKAAGADHRHQVRYRGMLLRVKGEYDPLASKITKDSFVGYTALGGITQWAQSGFLPTTCVVDPGLVQAHVDAITPTLASHTVKENSPVSTQAAFIGLAYHGGVAAVARRSGISPGEFTQESLDQIVGRNLVENPAFDVLQIGAPSAAAKLVGSIVEILDYAYIAMHGDMAFLLGCWVQNFTMLRFTSDRPALAIYRPVQEPVIQVGPGYPPVLPMRPLLPVYPGPVLEPRPVLTLQSTLYKRWEDLASGPDAMRVLAKEKEKIAIDRWLEDKPRASPPPWPLPVHPVHNRYRSDDTAHIRQQKSVGFNANLGLHPRLDFLKKFLAGSVVEERDKSVLSHMAYMQKGEKKDKVVKLNAGAYPRGGRKPPSITHDTTFGLDLDIDVHVKQQTVAEGERELSELVELEKFLRIFEDPQFTESVAVEASEEASELFAKKDDFLPSVAFTQALLATLPSHLFFGDPFVIIAAYGGLREKLKSQPPEVIERLPALFRDPQRYLIYEPKVHFNHWHVDWVPAEVLPQIKEIKDQWAFVPTTHAHWTLDGDFIAFQDKKRDVIFVRPVPIRYKPPKVCGTHEEIRELNGLLATGVDLRDEGVVPEVSPFPIGDVTTWKTLMGWLVEYFPKWAEPG